MGRNGDDAKGQGGRGLCLIMGADMMSGRFGAFGLIFSRVRSQRRACVTEPDIKKKKKDGMLALLNVVLLSLFARFPG